MTTAPQPLATRRRFRFGLRTLLVVVTLAAVGSWFVSIALPRWRDYREQMDFERAVNQLRQGDTFNKVTEVLGKNHLHFTFSEEWQPSGVICYTLPHNFYFVYFDAGPSGLVVGGAPQKIEVFRLHPPPNYVSSTLGPRQRYLDDFKLYFFERQHNPDFQYELIYSDPPAKPEGK